MTSQRFSILFSSIVFQILVQLWRFSIIILKESKIDHDISELVLRQIDRCLILIIT